MSGMEDQLGAILGDPVMMQKIQALAQSMGQSQPPGQPEKPERVVQPSPAGPGTGDLVLQLLCHCHSIPDTVNISLFEKFCFLIPVNFHKFR